MDVYKNIFFTEIFLKYFLQCTDMAWAFLVLVSGTQHWCLENTSPHPANTLWMIQQYALFEIISEYLNNWTLRSYQNIFPSKIPQSFFATLRILLTDIGPFLISKKKSKQRGKELNPPNFERWMPRKSCLRKNQQNDKQFWQVITDVNSHRNEKRFFLSSSK